MSPAEFLLLHHEADSSSLCESTGRVAVRYRRVIKTDPLTIDNRAFGLRRGGTQVELYPWRVDEWLKAEPFSEMLCVMEAT